MSQLALFNSQGLRHSWELSDPTAETETERESVYWISFAKSQEEQNRLIWLDRESLRGLPVRQSEGGKGELRLNNSNYR